MFQRRAEQASLPLLAVRQPIEKGNGMPEQRLRFVHGATRIDLRHHLVDEVDGTKNVAGLLGGNIVKGVSIFGVAGTAPPLQPLKTGQTTPFGTGSDGNVKKGVARSYTDNGDGTITDNKTGLMWEKKDQSGPSGIHDVHYTYTWSGPSYGSSYIMDGTITSTFLAALNGGSGFAGHTDWRIPNRFEARDHHKPWERDFGGRRRVQHQLCGWLHSDDVQLHPVEQLLVFH
jgi:hypothetical protein